MPIVHEEDYKKYLAGKRVVLVGPSDTVLKEKNGDCIDSYDVVVRLNRAVSHLEGQEEYIGNRTDILYACFSTGYINASHPRTGKLEVDYRLWEQNKIKFVSTTYPESEDFYNASVAHNVHDTLNNSNVNVRLIPNEPYYSTKHNIGCHLNSGMVAICDLLSSDLAELYITGIDFYRSLYQTGYETFSKQDIIQMFRHNSKHDPDKQFRHFKYNLFNQDKRISVDRQLGIFLSDPRFESYENSLDLIQ
jgi:hypothetical protein